METKKWTICHVGDGYSVNSKLVNAITIEEARQLGRKEEVEKPYLRFVGVLNSDITAAKLKKIRNDRELLEKHLKEMNTV